MISNNSYIHTLPDTKKHCYHCMTRCVLFFTNTYDILFSFHFTQITCSFRRQSPGLSNQFQVSPPSCEITIPPNASSHRQFTRIKALNNKNMKQIERQIGGEVKFATAKWPKSKMENGNY